MSRSVLSVSAVNRYIRSIIEEDVLLEAVFIEGEISNFTCHSSGHLYFSLKDEHASISCVMFRDTAGNLDFLPENGMSVMIYGRIGVFEKQGRYQLYAGLMERAGAGRLHAMFEALKEKLSAKGYFDPAHKRALPENPAVVAIVTSTTGAAVQDMIRIAGNLDPAVKLVIAPCLVQGDEAADSIARAIRMVNEWGGADVLIAGRGGGSTEDLWAFNEEAVAEAIFNSKIPVVSAVGHETDISLADFTADYRASTPSSAVAAVIRPREDMYRQLALLTSRLHDAMDYKRRMGLISLNALKRSSAFQRPLFLIEGQIKQLDAVQRLMNLHMNRRAEKSEEKSRSLMARLEEVSPVKTLLKGYSIVTAEGKVIKSIRQVKQGQKINVIVSDGKFSAQVLDKPMEGK